MINVSDLIGSKYKIHGRNKSEGFDCYGLIMEVEKRIGNELPDFDYEIDSPELFANCTRSIFKNHSVVKIKQYIEGAILLFENEQGAKVHIGVYIGAGDFVHCNYKGVHIDKVASLNSETTEVYVWQK